jgi:hypothetical protein
MLLKLLIGGQQNEAQFLITTASYCPRSPVLKFKGLYLRHIFNQLKFQISQTSTGFQNEFGACGNYPAYPTPSRGRALGSLG